MALNTVAYSFVSAVHVAVTLKPCILRMTSCKKLLSNQKSGKLLSYDFYCLLQKLSTA